MLSQQSSFRGMRTASICQAAMAATEAASCGPSKMPHPWIQAYSVPERLTPSNRIAEPFPLTRWLAATLTDRGVAATAAVELAADAISTAGNTSRSRRTPRAAMPPVSQPGRSHAIRIALPDSNSGSYRSMLPFGQLVRGQVFAEIGDGPHEAGLERGTRLPAEDPSSTGQVGTALSGVILGQRPVYDLAGTAAEIPNPGGQLKHADLIGGAQIDWITEIDVEQPKHALNKVFGIAEAARLRALAVDGDGLVLQRL